MISPATAAGPPLSGQVALVTGATDGIGLATARLLAELGAAIAYSYLDEAKPAKLVDELPPSTRETGIRADLSCSMTSVALSRPRSMG